MGYESKALLTIIAFLFNMRFQIFIALMLFSASISFAQKRLHPLLSIAANNNQTAFPFGKFVGLFAGPYHPGIEFGYSFNWSIKAKHDYFQRINAGYFYHRFAQHGIPVYTQIGFRYKFDNYIHLETALGGGYFHAIPATAQFKLNDNGEYTNGKRIGRPQAMLQFDLRASGNVTPASSKPLRLFLSYKQRLQTPFVKSYVPLLPYNIFEIGMTKQLFAYYPTAIEIAE